MPDCLGLTIDDLSIVVVAYIQKRQDYLGFKIKQLIPIFRLYLWCDSTEQRFHTFNLKT